MTDKRDMEIVFAAALHDKVIKEAVLNAGQTVWIATADLKDMHIPLARGYEPILEVFESMAGSGVRFRIIHSKIPSRSFRDTLDRCPNLTGGGLELQICPRSHWKIVLVDGRFVYFGSANFTGAGLGAKRPGRRNLELGAVSRDADLVRQIERLYDRFWIGEMCLDCTLKDECPDPISAQ